MSGVICYTSVNLDYLDRALVLERSIRMHCPDWHLVLLLVDDYPADPTIQAALGRFDEVLLAHEMHGAHFRGWVFGHDVVEACTAVKGEAMVRLLARDPEYVVYLDPDIMVFGDLDAALREVTGASLALTPHQLTPDTRSVCIGANEIGSLITGIFNLGFLCAWPTQEGHEFARWWAERLSAYCVDDVGRGLFTDQKWMNHAPVFFPQTRILRDPGMNVASWNLTQRRVEFADDGSCTVNGRPLLFWHFTKARSDGVTMTLRHGAQDTAVTEIWRHYVSELDREANALPDTTWAYGAFDDGTPIPKPARRLYRDRVDLQKAFPDPFATSGASSFLGWLIQSGNLQEASRAR